MSTPKCFVCKSNRVVELSRTTRALKRAESDEGGGASNFYTVVEYFCLDCGYIFTKVAEEEMSAFREYYGNWNMHIGGYE